MPGSDNTESGKFGVGARYQGFGASYHSSIIFALNPPRALTARSGGERALVRFATTR
jgi:hypothetical protein